MPRLSAVESFEFSNNPGLYAFGLAFSRDQPFIATGGAWYFSAGGPTTLTAHLYDAATEALLASGTASTSGWAVDEWHPVPFDVDYEAAASTGYVIGVDADGTNVYTNSADYPVIVDGFTVTEGRYNGGSGYPSSSWGGSHAAGLFWAEPPVGGTLHVRHGGLLVPTSTAGAVRLGGTSYPFGP